MNKKLISILILFLNLNFSICGLTIENSKVNNFIIVFKFTDLINKILVKDNKLILISKNQVSLVENYFLSFKNFNLSNSNNYISQEILIEKTDIFVRKDSKSDQFIICGDVKSKYGCHLLSINNKTINFGNEINYSNQIKFDKNDSKLLLPIQNNDQIQFLLATNQTTDYPFLSKLKLLNFEEKYKFKPFNYKTMSSTVGLNYEYYGLDIEFIYLFHYGYYVDGIYQRYAFVLKKEKLDSQSEYVTKLGLICLNDISFRSYTELKLTCANRKTKEIYSEAGTSYFGYADSYLVNETGIQSYNRTLFVTFNKKGLNNSILCAFNFEKIMGFYDDLTNELNSCNYDNLTFFRSISNQENKCELNCFDKMNSAKKCESFCSETFIGSKDS